MHRINYRNFQIHIDLGKPHKPISPREDEDESVVIINNKHVEN